jgi:hypothetical protein
MPDIAKLAESQRFRSGWINGVKSLNVAYRNNATTPTEATNAADV